VRIIEIPDPSLVVLVGAAGSGKTTFAARHFAPDEVLSSDAYRLMLTGDAADQRASGLAFRRLHEDLAIRLRDGRLTVVDATNVMAHARRVLLGRASEARTTSVAIVFDLPPDVVHAQNAGRPSRVVPTDVVDRHLVELRRAVDGGDLVTEGFVSIHRIDGSIAMDDVSVVRRPV
jgi:protein phosphatase